MSGNQAELLEAQNGKRAQSPSVLISQKSQVIRNSLKEIILRAVNKLRLSNFLTGVSPEKIEEEVNAMYLKMDPSDSTHWKSNVAASPVKALSTKKQLKQISVYKQILEHELTTTTAADSASAKKLRQSLREFICMNEGMVCNDEVGLPHRLASLPSIWQVFCFKDAVLDCLRLQAASLAWPCAWCCRVGWNQGKRCMCMMNASNAWDWPRSQRPMPAWLRVHAWVQVWGPAGHLKTIPEDNRRFWLQSQWTSSEDSTQEQLGQIRQQSTQVFPSLLQKLQASTGLL